MPFYIKHRGVKLLFFQQKAFELSQNFKAIGKSDLTREMVDPVIYTNNDMIIVPARCQAVHLPSRKLFLLRMNLKLLFNNLSNDFLATASLAKKWIFHS